MRVRVVDCPLGHVAGAALYANDYRGHPRLVVGEVPLDRLWHAVPAYPTISEIRLRLLEAYDQ